MSKLLAIEIVALLVVVAGIALVSLPAALVVLGVAVIAACEVRGGRDDGGDAS